MPRIEISREVPFEKPWWMLESDVKGFLAFRDSERLRWGKRLPQEELNFHSLMEWVRQGHSKDNPAHPEFPPWKPKFPASPTVKIHVPGAEHLNVYLKDESVNGTHKLRMAWEIMKRRHEALKNNLLHEREAGSIPDFSILSGGNAALAVGQMLQWFQAPAKVRALVDESTPKQVEELLERNNVRVYRTKLSREKFTSDDILRLTRNSNGIDLTHGKFVQFIDKTFYDWWSFEAMNLMTKRGVRIPDYVVMPYGTGHLFDNFMYHYMVQVYESKRDPRLLVKNGDIHGVNVVGVTAPVGSRMDKLSALFLPGSTKEEAFNQKINLVSQARRQGIVGQHSQITLIGGDEEEHLHKAIEVAKANNIKAEYSALASLAWLLKNAKEIPKGAHVVIVSTGKGIVASELEKTNKRKAA